MKKFIIIGALTLTTLFAQGSQPLEITQEDINAQNQISDASMKDITPKSLDEFFEEFAKMQNIEYGKRDSKGRYFYTGSANVLLNDNDPEFAKALANAYNKAILNLQAEFLRLNGAIKQKTLNDFNLQADNSTNAREFEEFAKGGTLDQLWDKLTELAGAQLDEALTNLGVNVEGLSKERKKTLFQEKLVTRIVENGFGEMSGLIPVQTFITQKRGEYQLGVVAVISDKTQQIARDMSHKRKSLIKGKGEAVNLKLPKVNADFINEYGIRLVYDENGNPGILSYGHWGFVPQANNRMTNRLEDVAKKQALSLADSAIIAFIKTNITFDGTNDTGENYEEIIKQTITAEGTENSEQTIINIIDKISQNIRTNSGGTLAGISTLKTWAHTAENGVEHVGVVRYYSYDNLPKSQTQNTKNNAVKTQSRTSNIERKSNVINSMDDF